MNNYDTNASIRRHCNKFTRQGNKNGKLIRFFKGRKENCVFYVK